MITIKSAGEIEKMRQSGDIAARAMEKVIKAVRPGVSTKELDSIAYNEITRAGAKPNFKGLNGFPGTICASVNEQVVHGFPGSRRLKEGDIISIDLGAVLHGYHSDMARTIAVGEVRPEVARLIKVTRECFYLGMAQALAGNRIVDISRAVQEHAEASGLGVVRELVGHGVGQELHEAPDVPNFVGRSKGPVLRPGITIAIEPMLNMGTEKVIMENNGWTFASADGSYSSHYENTIAVTDGEPMILTRLEQY